MESIFWPDGWPDVQPRSGNTRLMRFESISPWFEIYKVNDDTYALLEPQHYEEVISYLILGDELAVLFDSGMGIDNIRLEVERLTQLPITVINSHSHYDHIGGNYYFQDIWALNNNFEIDRIEKGYNHAQCEKFMQPEHYGTLPQDFNLTSYKICPSRITRRLQHLDVIALGGRELTIHHTPGETPGSICLFDSKYDLLFTGDLVYPGTLWAHLEESDVIKYTHSLRYLANLLTKVKHLCPAHNEAFVHKKLLMSVLEGFEQITEGQITGKLENNVMLFRFKEFNIALPN